MQLLQQCCRVGVKGVIWEQAARYGMIVQRWIACALVRRELCSLRSQGWPPRVRYHITLFCVSRFPPKRFLTMSFCIVVRPGATKFDFPRYSNLVAGFISNIRRFDFLSRKFEIPSRKFDSTCLNSLENESVFGAIFLPRDSILRTFYPRRESNLVSTWPLPSTSIFFHSLPTSCLSILFSASRL